MKKILKYVKGILKAVKGEYPFDELEQLERIKKTIHQDSIEGLPSSDARFMVDRYHQLTKSGWKSVYTLSSQAVARVINRTHGVTTSAPVVDIDIETYRDPYRYQTTDVEDEHSYN